MDKPTFVYVTYIHTTPEQLWQALTNSSQNSGVLSIRAGVTSRAFRMAGVFLPRGT